MSPNSIAHHTEYLEGEKGRGVRRQRPDQNWLGHPGPVSSPWVYIRLTWGTYKHQCQGPAPDLDSDL